MFIVDISDTALLFAAMPPLFHADIFFDAIIFISISFRHAFDISPSAFEAPLLLALMRHYRLLRLCYYAIAAMPPCRFISFDNITPLRCLRARPMPFSPLAHVTISSLKIRRHAVTMMLMPFYAIRYFIAISSLRHAQILPRFRCHFPIYMLPLRFSAAMRRLDASFA